MLAGMVTIDGDFMVHVFSPAQRANYNLEGLWKNGEKLDISDCVSGSARDRFEEEDETERVGSLDDWLS